MKYSVTNRGKNALFMPGGKLPPGHTLTYDLPPNLADMLKANEQVEIKRIRKKKESNDGG